MTFAFIMYVLEEGTKYHSDHVITFPPAITTACMSPASLMVSDSAKDLGRSKENSQTQTGAWERGWGVLCTTFAWSECAAIKNISLPIKDDLWILLQQSYWLTHQLICKFNSLEVILTFFESPPDYWIVEWIRHHIYRVPTFNLLLLLLLLSANF